MSGVPPTRSEPRPRVCSIDASGPATHVGSEHGLAVETHSEGVFIPDLREQVTVTHCRGVNI